MTPAVEVKGLAKAYGKTRALAGCSFRAEPGTIHCLLGENGSGKSTLVKILTGVIPPDAGTVSIAGTTVRRFVPKHLHAIGVATVFQELMNVPTRSVVDNAWLGANGWLRHQPGRRERTARTRAVLDELGGASIALDTLVGRLSLANQQVVAISRALLREPKVLILDEATSALDTHTRDRLVSVLRSRQAEQALTILFISHRMSEVTDLADMVTVLRSGVSVASVHREKVTVAGMVKLMSSRRPGPADV